MPRYITEFFWYKEDGHLMPVHWNHYQTNSDTHNDNLNNILRFIETELLSKGNGKNGTLIARRVVDTMSGTVAAAWLGEKRYI